MTLMILTSSYPQQSKLKRIHIKLQYDERPKLPSKYPVSIIETQMLPKWVAHLQKGYLIKIIFRTNIVHTSELSSKQPIESRTTANTYKLWTLLNTYKTNGKNGPPLRAIDGKNVTRNVKLTRTRDV